MFPTDYGKLPSSEELSDYSMIYFQNTENVVATPNGTVEFLFDISFINSPELPNGSGLIYITNQINPQ
jgi:hypothetical protein